ncbi:T9SS type A sorting domain-containing protein [bacterium]|nr:T9SS type A sorting domain-containing protein [bacterium]
MRKPNRILLIMLICPGLFRHQGIAQTSVNVTFRFYPASESVIRAFVPGSFNNWGPNSNGIIAANAPSRMVWSDTLQCYVKIIPLNANTIYQYKFHEHPDNQWITDPLNPDVNTADNNNSIITARNGMLFQIQPKNGTILTDTTIEIVASVCVAKPDSVLPDLSFIELDGEILTSFQGAWTDSLSVLRYPLQNIDNGTHTVRLHVKTRDELNFSDSTTFTAFVKHLFFITPDQENVFASPKTLRWRVNLEGMELDSLVLREIGGRDSLFVPATESDYTARIECDYGQHCYVVRARETGGTLYASDTLTLNFPEPQLPEPEIQLSVQENMLVLTALANDPQNQTVSFQWRNGSANRIRIPGLDGRTGSHLELPIPDTPGDYAIHITAEDSDGNHNTTQSFFTVTEKDSVILPDMNTVPQWIREACIYSMFIRGFTGPGTIQSAANRLHYIRNLGFSVIWVLPVMDVEGVLDQNTNIGYNIVDFYNVEPLYGSNQDFRDFVSAAHDLGLRVILDVTPNHSSRSHPFALDARNLGPYSRYWDFYQHEIIPHNTNNLGQSVSPDGIVYYSDFSSALLNWNWEDAEARQYMIRVYQHWLRDYDIDGFRLDVYWGPHRRYGPDCFDLPLRKALRAAKADILILGEADGTGIGTESLYADQAGGVDMAYDWNLMWNLNNFPSISTLHEKLVNWGYRPGDNSYFLRFLENHDEWRVAQRYNSIEKTIPVSTSVFLSTGTPMCYQGQEVGMGFGLTGSKETLARSTVNWQNPPACILAPHYQKLAQIRAQFPQFRRQPADINKDGQINASDKSVQPRLSASSNSIYAFGRPWPDENAVVIMNFSGEKQEADIRLDSESWMEWVSVPAADTDYLFASNIYSNTSVPIPGDSETLHAVLEPYGVAVFILGKDKKSVNLPALSVNVISDFTSSLPDQCQLYPNFPNPFNQATIIMYYLEKSSKIMLEVLNIQGQRVKILASGVQMPGIHRVQWHAMTDQYQPAPSGIYLLRLATSERVINQKIILIR